MACSCEVCRRLRKDESKKSQAYRADGGLLGNVLVNDFKGYIWVNGRRRKPIDGLSASIRSVFFLRLPKVGNIALKLESVGDQDRGYAQCGREVERWERASRLAKLHMTQVVDWDRVNNPPRWVAHKRIPKNCHFQTYEGDLDIPDVARFNRAKNRIVREFGNGDLHPRNGVFHKKRFIFFDYGISRDS